MTSEALLRKGWCPGARRPMPAKDGLLIRLRISGGRVMSATLRALAKAGRDHGNGLFDLTTRGNLQIRGVHERSQPALLETLDGLGLIDEDAAKEAVRNVLVSPLAGLDGRSEAREAAKALEATLGADKDLYGLPGKFGFLIDDGSALSLGAIPADIRFDWNAGTQSFAIGIGGNAKEAVHLGYCGGGDIPSIALRLARVFLRLQSSMEEPPRRMAGLLAHRGAKAITEMAGLRVTAPPRVGAIEDPCPIGLMRFHDKYGFGAGAAFGLFDATMLDAAARAADEFGTGEIRLTPWRALILPYVSEAQTTAMRSYFAAHGFITDPEDARLAVTACGGNATCAQGTTDTRADAMALMGPARGLRPIGAALHVSGCVKGCGRQAAPLTLIAHDGLYDLVTDPSARDVGAADARRLGLAAMRDTLQAAARNTRPRRALGSGQP